MTCLKTLKKPDMAHQVLSGMGEVLVEDIEGGILEGFQGVNQETAGLGGITQDDILEQEVAPLGVKPESNGDRFFGRAFFESGFFEIKPNHELHLIFG